MSSFRKLPDDYLPHSSGNRWQSLRHAARGVLHLMRSEPNVRIHIFATGAVALVGWWLGVSRTEAGLLALACGIVWCAEAGNTALERLADTVHPEIHPGIGRAKDVAAGGVLLAAATAVVIGSVIFIPRLLERLGAI